MATIVVFYFIGGNKMSEKNQQKTLRRLEDFPASEPSILMFRNGTQKTVNVYDFIEELRGKYLLVYAVGGLPDVECSKVDPRDWLPRTPFHELVYVRSQYTGRKVSFMPFQP